LTTQETKCGFEEQQAFFPFGVQYHRAPTPLPEEWATDLREIKRVGFTHIQLRPQWRWHERIRGNATWDDLDRLFDLARANELRVVLKPMLETAPDWVFTELEGTRIGVHGVPISPFAHGAYYVGGWWPCFDNPQVLSAATDFVKRMVERYHNHPALWFYNAWNEPVSRPVGQCQCPHSINSYRKWLKKQYGSIEQLNTSLGKAWTSFETLYPPVAWEDYTELFLWRQWAGHAIAEQVKAVADTIRSVDSKAFVMVHIGCSSLVQDPVCSTSDDLLNAQTTDRYGTSFPIPLHPVTPIDHDQPDYQSDWLRRVDPAYWCHEFYPNHGQWCVPSEPRTLNRLVWMAIAGGCSGMTFWQYRSERVGNETNGYGMRNIDGSPTDRSQVIDAIARTLSIFGPKLIGTRRPVSPIGLLYDRKSDLIMRIQESKSSWTQGGLAHEQEIYDYSYKTAIKAAHAFYQVNGLTVEWVVPGDDLTPFRLLHVTCAELVEPQTARWLEEYVHQGGHLIVEFPFAGRDSRTWVTLSIPSCGLENLLGCRQINRVVNDGSCPSIATFSSGQVLQAQKWKIDLEPISGKPIAFWNDGKIAAVEHTFGRGTVWTLGCNASLAFKNDWNDPAVSLFSSFVNQAIPDLESCGSGDIWIKKRVSDTCEIWFVFNISPNNQDIVLPRLPGEVWQDFGCILNGLQLTLEPGATWVAQMPLQKD
jgi:hypothetical protein